jgi:hypothetical protein
LYRYAEVFSKALAENDFKGLPHVVGLCTLNQVDP